MKEYILLDDDNNVVNHICADDNFTSEKYKVVEALNWEQETESELEPVIEQESVISTDTDVVEETKQQEDKTLFTGFTRTDELMLQFDKIDLASVRSIRAILSGTNTEEDHKTLEALEKQAINLRQELNVTTVNTDVNTNK